MTSPMTPFASPTAASHLKSAIQWRARHANKINVAIGGVVFAVVSALLLDGMAPVRFRPDITPLLETRPMVQVHVLAAVTAFVIGCVLLAGVKGNTLHRALGYTWVAAMATTAASSFMLFGPIGSFLSLIHVLSAWTLIVLPMAVAAARRGNIRAHAQGMTGMFVGGMVIAGLFTFLPGRLMWSLLFTA